MRRFTLMMVAVLVCLPLAPAAPNPVPLLAIRLDQASQSVNVTENSSATAVFTGECMVSKLPYVKATVTLTASTDRGWAAQVNPVTMVFTTTDPQAFTATVVVPAATPNGTATLFVNGTIVANGLQSLSQTKAVLSVTGPAPAPPAANQTGNGTNSTARPSSNRTAGGGFSTVRADSGFLGLGNDRWMMVGATVMLVGAVVALAARARRRRRAQDVEPDNH